MLGRVIPVYTELNFALVVLSEHKVTEVNGVIVVKNDEIEVRI